MMIGVAVLMGLNIMMLHSVECYTVVELEEYPEWRYGGTRPYIGNTAEALARNNATGFLNSL